MKDDKTISAYNQNVDKYLDMVNSNNPDIDTQAFINNLPPSSRVLDLGCGPGNSSNFFCKAGHHVDAIDASPEMVRIANEMFDLEARVGTFEDIDQVEAYEGVWANFSLLHAPKSEFPRYLSAIHNSLKNSGIFHIGMKLGTDSSRDQLGRYYAYYGKDELISLVEDASFEIFRCREGEGKGLAGNIDPWIVIQSRAEK